ncbi:sensor histidine kinase [Burkholderia thailandensis]|uniref:sensor histidine kinase n=1 Tax=Burkholderia thailandensis TaxID=57975 RepID=UPI00016A8B4C|nr:ATP-binding protein [Burkholderia thailandensis]AIS94257.1 histidine kinase family protein [Burkholderia thailandensis MSMB59]AOJ43893.1 histidine kinase [Burkholderia thailandensis]AVR09351.1 sensor histidine kinase [Burkholderia thailandensis]KIS58135.1 histidine kinase family protein [Burkholderia thailandensis Phuket 4W-1]KVG09957.1 histidine kinase [Burkholderia thailandensis]
MDTPSIAPSTASVPASSSSDLASEVGIPFVSRSAPRAPTAERLGARVAQLSAELVAADESARRHLAGELHDGLGADLTAARFALANVDTWLPDDAADACRRALALAQQALDAATAANRRLIDGLCTPALEAGLVGTLAAWIGAHGARTGLRTSFVCAADARVTQLSADGALAIFRVAQEALANVAKHAHASAADVRIDVDDTHLTLVVADDGVGIATTRRRGGYGLGSMRARCEALGGTLEFASPRSGGAGTALRARFAWGALVAARTPAAARRVRKEAR